METRQWMTIPVDEFEALHAQIQQLRAHDKEATDLTIDQQVEIGRLDTALRRLLEHGEHCCPDVVALAKEGLRLSSGYDYQTIG